MTANFDQVPNSYCQNPATFAAFFNGANSARSRMILFGDSRSTAPNGAGVNLTCSMNILLRLQYGNWSETPCQGPGDDDPPFDLVVSNSGSFGTGTLSAAQLPYNYSSNVPVQGTNGFISLLDYSGDRLPVYLANMGTAFNWTGLDLANLATDTVGLEIFGVARPTSSDLNVIVMPNTSSSYSRSLTITHQSAAGMSMVGSQAIVRGTYSVPYAAGNPYVQTIVNSNSTVGAEFLAVRYYNQTNPAGITLNPMGRGGGTTAEFLAASTGWGLVLQGCFPIAVPTLFLLNFGAHEAANGDSVDTFKANTILAIAQVRSLLGNPNALCILMSPPAQAGLTGPEQTVLNQMPGALYEIAQSDPLVMSLNIRNMTNQQGWNFSTTSQFTVDGIHENVEGAMLLSRVAIAAMTNAPTPAEFYAILDEISEYIELENNAGVVLLEDHQPPPYTGNVNSQNDLILDIL